MGGVDAESESGGLAGDERAVAASPEEKVAEPKLLMTPLTVLLMVPLTVGIAEGAEEDENGEAEEAGVEVGAEVRGSAARSDLSGVNVLAAEREAA